MIELLYAILDRARGSKLFGLTHSTTEARLVSAFGMSLLSAMAFPSLPVFLWSLASLYFWQVFGWGKYFAAVHGHIDPGGGSVKPVDWLMRRLNLPTDTEEDRKRWGTVAMGLRQAFIAPYFIGLAVLSGHYDRALLAAFTPFMGIPYYLGGKISQQHAVEIAELINGALIGVLSYDILTR